MYEVATEATGHYNLAPEVWLTREKPNAFAPNPSLISTEIMFWVESAGQARPAGGVIDHTVVDGKRYDLWRMEGAGDKGNGDGWRLLSFTLRETERKGTLPIDALLEFLVEAGQIDPQRTTWPASNSAMKSLAAAARPGSSASRSRSRRATRPASVSRLRAGHRTVAFLLQKALKHSAASAQLAPFAFSLRQTLFTQRNPAWQAPLPAVEARQASPFPGRSVHTPSLHDCPSGQ